MSAITREYVQMMARYNAWQNKGLRGMLAQLSEADLTRDRKAFFGSILGTANHLLWADMLWMSRFDGGAAPQGGIKESPALTPRVSEWEMLRHRTDGRINSWAASVREIDLAGDLTWFSGAVGRELSKPLGVCVAHFFNHQTHHRGQIHAMLTAAGQSPGDTDLALLPET
ncbi:DinB family protein [Roseobacteraceae bacterium S113]